MSIFNKTGLSSSELKKLADKANCSKGEIKKRIETCLNKGLSLEFLLENNMYLMTLPQLRELFSKKAIKRYVDLLVDRDDINVRDAYSQLKRARKEFGIPYAVFVSNQLTDADDEALKQRGEVEKKKKNRYVKRIARVLGSSTKEAREKLDHITKKYGYSPSTVYLSQLFLLTDKELDERKAKSRELKRAKFADIKSQTGWSDEEIEKHIAYCKTEFGMAPSLYYVCGCYKMTPEEIARCGNMRDSNRLSKKYNKGSESILNNKTKFNQTYRKHIGRKFWVNEDTDFEEFKKFADGLTTLFCKPNNLSLGTGTFKVELEGRNLEDVFEELMSEPKLLVEECLVQHPEMAKFYEPTLNTVRLFTVLDDDKFDAFASFVRFGVKGVTDNFSAGGIGCQVDPETGIVLTDGVTKDGDVFKEHPVTKVVFRGFQIPHWDKVLEKAEAAIREVDSVNYVGWDVAIRDNDVVFVEGNATPDLGVQQSLAMQDGGGGPMRNLYEKYLPENAAI